MIYKDYKRKLNLSGTRTAIKKQLGLYKFLSRRNVAGESTETELVILEGINKKIAAYDSKQHRDN